ncbi:MAG TPA: preprotein translocase subunit YajC [Gemmataceae bacterium]|nr:preprotein translocase subunit YajC [Gemmataceae bacterium]
MASWYVLLAQADAAQPQAPTWFTYLPFIILGVMLVMFFRASAKQKRELRDALAAVKRNDKVVTSGGILGVVVAVKENEDEVTLRVDDTSNTRIRVLKSSIVRITSGDQTTGEVKTS